MLCTERYIHYFHPLSSILKAEQHNSKVAQDKYNGWDLS
jgi:hypothetical protein